MGQHWGDCEVCLWGGWKEDQAWEKTGYVGILVWESGCYGDMGMQGKYDTNP